MGTPVDFTAADRGLVLDDTLIVADLHLGRGASSGFDLPLGDGTDVLDRFRSLLDAYDPATVVLAGDVLHSFRTVPRPVRQTFGEIESAVSAADADLRVLSGNHDTKLASVWDGSTADAVRIGEAVVCHGHEVPAPDADRYVFGHDHPTIVIEGERRPCFLAGPGGPDGQRIVVLPAFNRVLRGVPVNDLDAASLQSPLIHDVDPLRPIVPDGSGVLPFPPLGDLRQRL